MKRIVALVAFLSLGLAAAIVPQARTTEAQANCFPETGFCITNQQFANYLRLRGGVRTLGYPISRSFMLDGSEVQFFQRVVLQMQGNAVGRLNILDPGVMPMTRANQSVFPGPDPQIAAQAPKTTSPTYAQDVVQFIQNVSPNTFNGQAVKFFDTFIATVPPDMAFGGAAPNPSLLTLLNLEIWGLPTSNPAPDPGNPNFVYQRFQRGIMHYDASCRCTQGILVGEYLKAVIINRDLPTDLAEDMQGSRFLGQYNPGSPDGVARSGELANSNLTNAFEPGARVPSSAPLPAAPTAPTVTIQVDDDLIEPGQQIRITVVARSASGLDWIEWQGDGTGDPRLDENHRFSNCNRRTECGSVWDVMPTTPGRHQLRARAQNAGGTASEWTTVAVRVREGPVPPTVPPPPPAPAPPAPVPAPTAGCHPSYPDFCIPPPPPDINCNSPVIAGRRNFRVTGLDVHRLDQGGRPGIACES